MTKDAIDISTYHALTYGYGYNASDTPPSSAYVWMKCLDAGQIMISTLGVLVNGLTCWAMHSKAFPGFSSNTRILLIHQVGLSHVKIYILTYLLVELSLDSWIMALSLIVNNCKILIE